MGVTIATSCEDKSGNVKHAVHMALYSNGSLSPPPLPRPLQESRSALRPEQPSQERYFPGLPAAILGVLGIFSCSSPRYTAVELGTGAGTDKQMPGEPLAFHGPGTLPDPLVLHTQIPPH